MISQLISTFVFTVLSTQTNAALSVGDCAQCTAADSLLSQCSLPSLSTSTQTLGQAVRRNVSGVVLPSLANVGPVTTILKSYQEASCLCVQGLSTLQSCNDCLGLPGSTAVANAQGLMIDYYLDCNAFGYYYNTSLAYPSTTLASQPTVTSIPSSEANAISGCSDCNIVADQIAQFGVPALDQDPPPHPINLDLPPPDSYTNLFYLADRKAAESFCTEPVV